MLYKNANANANVYFSIVNTHSKRVHDYSRRVKPASCNACDSKTASEAEKEYIMNAMKGIELISPKALIPDSRELGISVTYYEAAKICGDC